MADWKTIKAKQEAAAMLAGAIVRGTGISKPPIDPLAIVESERPRLIAFGDDFGEAFDGRLEYQAGRFLLFFNTKYDTSSHVGNHHPRVTFSIGHELGHYYLDEHREFLQKSRNAHGSRSEFARDNLPEREADAFASGLLLPEFLAKSMVNQKVLTLERLDEIAESFQTSLICTAFRSIALSDDPCAVAGIKDGRVAWMFNSDRLIEGGCYPMKDGAGSRLTQERWRAFQAGDTTRARSDEGRASDWFQLFGKSAQKSRLYLTESILPVKIMGTLLVLLTIDDDDLFL